MTDRPPPLFGEECVFALLFRMVQDHCSTMNAGELKSYGIEANADGIVTLTSVGPREATSCYVVSIMQPAERMFPVVRW